MKRPQAVMAAVLLGIGMASASRAVAGMDLGRTEA